MIVQPDMHFHLGSESGGGDRPGYAAAMRLVAPAPARAGSRVRLIASWLAPVVLVAVSACQRSESRGASYGNNYGSPPPGQYAPPGQYPGQYPPPPGQYAPPGQYPGQYPSPGQPPPGQPPAQPPPFGQPPALPPPALPGLPVPNDPINAVDLSWLRQESGQVMAELVGALSPAAQAKVKDIPYFADTTVGEVNAFAGCDDQGLPLMAISDGLLEVEAHIAQFKATDEIFGTRKLEAYEQMLAQSSRPNQPIPRPAPGFVDPGQHADGRKVARQHQIFQEQVAFVLGHELAHHHLGHTGCANGGGSRGISAADFGRVLSRAVPVFNQPNEIAADVAGTNNLLTAGTRHQGYRWTEGGAVLTVQFFAAIDQLTPASIVFGFERTHPHPLVRLPIIQSTANTWRMTGGAPLGIPGLFGG